MNLFPRSAQAALPAVQRAVSILPLSWRRRLSCFPARGGHLARCAVRRAACGVSAFLPGRGAGAGRGLHANANG